MGINRGASGMRNQNWLCRSRNGLTRRAIPAVTQVNSHANFVHLLNSRDACIAQPSVSWLKTAVAEDAAIVISNLHDPDTKIAEHDDAIGVIFQKARVLKTGNYADLVLALG